MSETHGITRHRLRGKTAAMADKLRAELSRVPPPEQLARAVDAINARRPDVERLAYDAVAEALGQ